METAPRQPRKRHGIARNAMHGVQKCCLFFLFCPKRSREKARRRRISQISTHFPPTQGFARLGSHHLLPEHVSEQHPRPRLARSLRRALRHIRVAAPETRQLRDTLRGPRGGAAMADWAKIICIFTNSSLPSAGSFFT